MRHLLKVIAFVAAAVCMVACGDDVSGEYNTDTRVYFAFNAGLHPGNALWTAIQPGSSLQFAMVSKNSRTNVHITDQNGHQTDVTVTTEIEAGQSYELGVYNGLVIGRDANHELYAFDRQCPNCRRETGLVKYALQWTNNGQALKCTHCGRSYDLSLSGGTPDSTGRKLDRYHASYNESSQILIVSN